MKWIKYAALGFGAIVLVALVVLVAMGGGRGTSQLRATIDIARPAPVVFRWISEPERLKAWVGWLVDVRSLTPEHATPGARQVWVMEDRNNNNQRMDIASEVVRVEADRSLTANLTAAQGFTGAVTYDLAPTGADTTRLTYTADYTFDHWLARLLNPIITRAAQQKLDEDLARLKLKAEAAPPDVAQGR
jgi:uncharacterized protein YndB with AHSA1/START domain